MPPQFITYLEDVVEDDDGLAAVGGGVSLSPVDLPEPLDLRGAEADDLARQRPRAASGDDGRRDVEPPGAQDARRHHALCNRKGFKSHLTLCSLEVCFCDTVSHNDTFLISQLTFHIIKVIGLLTVTLFQIQDGVNVKDIDCTQRKKDKVSSIRRRPIHIQSATRSLTNSGVRGEHDFKVNLPLGAAVLCWGGWER